MNITLMEKVYKDNKFVLYVNGFVGAISDNTMIDSSIEVLTNVGYNIKDVNYIVCLNDDVPNNEADCWHEGTQEAPVHLSETLWVHNCSSGCCFDVGSKIEVNHASIVAQDSLVNELSGLLSKLGHPVSPQETEAVLLSKPGYEIGDCLHYETSIAVEDSFVYGSHSHSVNLISNMMNDMNHSL